MILEYLLNALSHIRLLCKNHPLWRHVSLIVDWLQVNIRLHVLPVETDLTLTVRHASHWLETASIRGSHVLLVLPWSFCVFTYCVSSFGCDAVASASYHLDRCGSLDRAMVVSASHAHSTLPHYVTYGRTPSCWEYILTSVKVSAVVHRLLASLALTGTLHLIFILRVRRLLALLHNDIPLVQLIGNKGFCISHADFG